MGRKIRGQNLNRTLFVAIKSGAMGFVLGSIAVAFQRGMSLTRPEMESFAMIYAVLTFVSVFMNAFFEIAWQDLKDIKLSRLGWLNFLVFQWFWVRRARVVDDETLKTTSYKWIKVYPLTGWNGNPLRLWGGGWN
jgi:hypothetical protein